MGYADAHRVVANANPEARAVMAIALVGPGRVGSALLKRLTKDEMVWPVMAVANSRHMHLGQGLDSVVWPGAGKRQTTDLEVLADSLLDSPARRKVIVDASASPDVAARHASWLDAGFNVVTANKWALAAPGNCYRRLALARNRGRAQYEHAATVGAGLPVLSTIRALKLAGETINGIGGALSGTMSFLTSRVNAGYTPSKALAEARRMGLTEPDPRADLNGLDVARKLVILAREAGHELDLADVQVDSLVPEELVEVTLDEFLAAESQLDARWASQLAGAPGSGEFSCHVGRWTANGQARVGLEKVSADHALASLGASDNLVEIHTDCYSDSPITIRGPGAGIEVTALALWSGLCRISAQGTKTSPPQRHRGHRG